MNCVYYVFFSNHMVEGPILANVSYC